MEVSRELGTMTGSSKPNHGQATPTDPGHPTPLTRSVDPPDRATRPHRPWSSDNTARRHCRNHRHEDREGHEGNEIILSPSSQSRKVRRVVSSRHDLCMSWSISFPLCVLNNLCACYVVCQRVFVGILFSVFLLERVSLFLDRRVAACYS